MNIVIRPAGRRDIDRNADYIGERNRRAGRRFYAAVEDALNKLAAMPELGGTCDFDAPGLSGLRVWSIKGFENYLVYYLPGEGCITVVRVLHGAQDAEAIFGAG